MTKRYQLLLFVAFVLIVAGCAHKTVVNVDGMPVSNYEYNLTNEETGIRAVFVLARYHREYEGKEYLIKPDYLDTLTENKIDADDTEQLVLHAKVINLKSAYYSFSWKVTGPLSLQNEGQIYSGRLSRRDFFVRLPVKVNGTYQYSIAFADKDGDELFDLPPMRYKLKGGVARTSKLEP